MATGPARLVLRGPLLHLFRGGGVSRNVVHCNFSLEEANILAPQPPLNIGSHQFSLLALQAGPARRWLWQFEQCIERKDSYHRSRQIRAIIQHPET
jgi:hypothetical protein